MEKVVVVDLEMCNVPKECKTKEYHYSLETIQIGAALLDENNEIVDTFNTYVHPEYGRIEDFIEELTGIKNKDVMKAPSMKEAMEAFLNWVPEDAVCASWSHSDDTQIQREAKAKGFESERLNRILTHWLDVQAMFGHKISSGKNYALQEALYAVGVDAVGRAHDGLTDAYNTALLLAKMRKEPDLKFIPLYEGLRSEEHETLSVSLGDFLKDIKLDS